MRFAAILTPLPLGPLDYAVPEGMRLETGDFVEVAVRGRKTPAVVWGEGQDRKRLKPVLRRLDLPPMPAATRAFLDKAAAYTLTPPGMMLRLATRAPDLLKPPATRAALMRGGADAEPLTDARRRVLALFDERPGLAMPAAEIAREAGVSPGVVRGLAGLGALTETLIPQDAPFAAPDPSHAPPDLSTAQAEAAAILREGVRTRSFSPVLLEGVTGSGKTEVYLEAIAETVRSGRQALVLLPEIALTTDFTRRLTARFGAAPAEWHSGTSPSERRRVWRAVADGGASVAVGARSALFLPFADLGLIVVDEEHDAGYKQEDQVLYQARDMAVLRASLAGAAVVLASATPSLESWVNAQAGRYAHASLPARYGAAVLPAVSALDLRLDPPDRRHWIAPALAEAAAEALSRREQVLFFLNRRGYAPLTLCRKCGWRAGCPLCSTWLVEHRARGRMLCHQCGHAEPVPPHCPDCGSEDHLTACGPGVERIAEEVAERFPAARTVVLASDMEGGADALRAQMARVARGEADIIIGTQIVAKGHNFPDLTLVGVIDADMGLRGGDLRAAERTVQTLAQVSGRAGRAARPGRAILQTTVPDHPAIRAIVDHDLEGFRRIEAERRRQDGMPPFGRLAAVIVSAPQETAAWEAARQLARNAAPVLEVGAALYGPAPAPFAMLRGRHRVRLLVHAPRSAPLQKALEEWREGYRLNEGVRIVFDIDPYSFL